MFLGRPYLILSTLGCLVPHAHSLRNISFDDTEKSAITYSSTGTGTGQWVGAEGGKGLGTHTSSREWFAYALFNFTGVAVYYWAPLFGDNIIIDFSLDGGPSTSVSLADPDVPNGGWVMTKESAVRRSFLNLENKLHTLRISMDGRRSTAIIVDYFEVTVDDDGLFQSLYGGSSTPPFSTSTPPSKSQETSNSTNTNDGDLQSKYNSLQESYNNIKMALIIVTALFGVFAVVCFTLIILLGGLRVFAKIKDPEEQDKAKEQVVPVKEDLDHPAGQNADLSPIKSVMNELDGKTASALDGSN